MNLKVLATQMTLMGNPNLLLVAHYFEIWSSVSAHVITCNLIFVLNNTFVFGQNHVGQWSFDMFKVLVHMNVELIY
jgi:hypothetical protein